MTIKEISIQCSGTFRENKRSSSCYQLTGSDFVCDPAEVVVESLRGRSEFSTKNQQYDFSFTLKTSIGEFVVVVEDHFSGGSIQGSAPFLPEYLQFFEAVLPSGVKYSIRVLTFSSERVSDYYDPNEWQVNMEFKLTLAEDSGE
jgi:hypothetical protein